MEQPRISIITISYNSAATIEDTIESVVAQDYTNKEYLIIDGDSTDGTQAVVKKYGANIDVFVSEKDKGRSDAFNKGIKLATGDIILLLNSDDCLLPGVLSKVASEYDGETDIYSGNVVIWNVNTDYKCRVLPSLDFPTMPFFRRPNHQGLFVTKRLYVELGGYDTNLDYAMDLDFLMRSTAQKKKFKYMDIDVAVFRLGGATSESIFKKRKEYVRVIKKNGGTNLQAYTFYLFLVLTQTTKKVLQLSGFDIVRRFRYRKTN